MPPSLDPVAAQGHSGTVSADVAIVAGHGPAAESLTHLNDDLLGYKELARTWLFAARETWSLPVLSRGLLYIGQHSRGVGNRSGPRLLCYDLRAEK